MNQHWMYLEAAPAPNHKSTLPIDATDELGRPIKHALALELIDLIPLNKTNQPIVNVTPTHAPEHVKHPQLLTLSRTHDVIINWYLSHERTQFVLQRFAKNTALNLINEHQIHVPDSITRALHSNDPQHHVTAYEQLVTNQPDSSSLKDRLLHSLLHAIIQSSPHNAAALAVQNSMRLHERNSPGWWNTRQQNNTDITNLVLHAHQHYPAAVPRETPNRPATHQQQQATRHLN